MAISTRMRTVKMFNLTVIVLCIVCITGQASSSGEFIIQHKPSYVTLLPDAGSIRTSDVPKLIASSLGLQLNEDLHWKGLAEGQLFRRPKASVLFSVEGLSSDSLPSGLKLASYPTEQDEMLVDTERVSNYIQSSAAQHQPIIVDFSLDNTVFDLHSRHPKLFSKLPATYSKLSKLLSEGDPYFTAADLGSLNLTEQADVIFLGELYIAKETVRMLRSNHDAISSKVPDFYHFRVRGIKALAEKNGKQSPQVKDAAKLLWKTVEEVSEQYRQLYKDNVIVQLVMLEENEDPLSRKSRSLLQDPIESTTVGLTPGSLNVASPYGDGYPVVFNIMLWTMILLGLTVLGVSYGIWVMDPGRDSIIYRMTTQRIKKD